MIVFYCHFTWFFCLFAGFAYVSVLVLYRHIGACLFIVILTPVCDAFACFSWLCWCFSCFVTHSRILAYFGKIKLTLDLLPVSNYGDSESVVSMLAYCCRVAQLRCFFFWCLYRCLLKLTYRCSVISVLLAELHTFAWYENQMHSNAIDLYHYSWFFPLSTIIFVPKGYGKFVTDDNVPGFYTYYNASCLFAD
jgi:hypothetical protein